MRRARHRGRIQLRGAERNAEPDPTAALSDAHADALSDAHADALADALADAHADALADAHADAHPDALADALGVIRRRAGRGFEQRAPTL